MEKQTQQTTKRKLKGLQHWQGITILLVIYDIAAVTIPYFLALWFRFDCQISLLPDYYIKAWAVFAPFYAAICVAVLAALKLYKSIWRFASYYELWRVILATMITGTIHIVGITVFVARMPISYYVFGLALQFLLVLAVRFAYRFILLLRSGRSKSPSDRRREQVMLIGAGSAGRMLLQGIQRGATSGDQVACIIDDNPNKWGRYIDGVPVVGGRDEIFTCVKRYRIDKIYLAIPSAPVEERRDILNICNETGCKLKNLPGLYQLAAGEVTVRKMKDVSIEDLLGRDPIETNLEEVYNFIRGKVVLVTGGGGSIGSELCRQIAAHSPKQLIIFDVYENNAYQIQLELRDKYPELDLVTLIGSVRDSRRMMQIFADYQPELVCHAAAHKHVPLMEDSPCETIKNNVIGTYKTAYAAMAYGCKRFVLISTDKAVNPVNIMGASKRLCEMVIQLFDRKIREGRAYELPFLFSHKDKGIAPLIDLSQAHTEFAAVRFGNVLGSNGSVIPLFKHQIEQGGPVTVTHPDIVRYFMTIPEAVSLVLLASTYAEGSEIFVLDMGSPMKIDTLARNMIRLSGYEPDKEIEAVYTGLRPGEKLYEERLMAEEGMRTTRNKMIHIGKPIPFDADQFLLDLSELMDAAYDNRKDIRQMVMKVVPTYHPAGITEQPAPEGEPSPAAEEARREPVLS